MKFSLAQVLGILAVFAGSTFATFTYYRMTDSSSHEAKIRQSYVNALIRDFTREADFLATQIEAAKADSVRMEALMASMYSDDATPETAVAMLKADLGTIVDGMNPLGFGMMHSLETSGEVKTLPRDIRNGLSTLSELHADLRFVTDHAEWIVAQNAAWTGDTSATDIQNETTRWFGLLAIKRYSLKTLTEKRRAILAETTHMLALLNDTSS